MSMGVLGRTDLHSAIDDAGRLGVRLGQERRGAHVDRRGHRPPGAAALHDIRPARPRKTEWIGDDYGTTEFATFAHRRTETTSTPVPSTRKSIPVTAGRVPMVTLDPRHTLNDRP